MSPRVTRLFTLLLVVTGVMVLSPATSRAAVPASQPAAGAPSPRAAVLQLVRPFYDGAAQGKACNPVTGKLAACPVTARLRQAIARELAWERAHTRGGDGNAFCRCQNPPRSVTISGVRVTGSTAQVTTVWRWGAGNNVRLSWLVRRVAGGWLVDNSYCTGYPSKDLYHNPIGPCR